MKVLMLLDNDFSSDLRVKREASALAADGHEVRIWAISAGNHPKEEMQNGFRVERRLDQEVTRYRSFQAQKKAAEEISGQDFDVLHCHDQAMLSIGARVKRIRPDFSLVYDSHELFSEWPVNYSDPKSRWLRLKSDLIRILEVRRERRSAWAVDEIVTVSQSIAKILMKQFSTKKVEVIRNIADYCEITQREDYFRNRYKLPPSTRLVVNFTRNVYWESQNTKRVILEFANKPDIAFIYVGEEKGGNRPQVEKWVAEMGFLNIYFHPPLSGQDIVNRLADADVGIITDWEKRYLSYWYALSNKLFHYTMSEIPTLSGATPEHQSVIQEYGIGVAVDADRAGAYLEGFKRILLGLDVFKRKTAAAKKVLNWDAEKEKLLALYHRIGSERAKGSRRNQ